MFSVYCGDKKAYDQARALLSLAQGGSPETFGCYRISMSP